jgi:hypothetical protein
LVSVTNLVTGKDSELRTWQAMHSAYPAQQCFKAQADNICGAGGIHFKSFMLIFCGVCV